MEPISVSVNVTVDFSESTKAFIQGLLSGQVTNSVEATPKHTVEAKPTTPTASKPAPAASKPATSSDITIDEVRNALSLKVNAHRAEIKNKLNELGAPSVTKLDTSKYKDMYDFLIALD